MSIVSYTFLSSAFKREITAVLTVPEEIVEKKEPFSAILLFPPQERESDYWLRSFALENFVKTSKFECSVSFPGWIPENDSAAIDAFISQDLKMVSNLFRLKISIVFFAFALDQTAKARFEKEEIDVYQSVSNPLSVNISSSCIRN